MTQTVHRPTLDAADPQARVDAWLSDFEDALRARDVDRAAGMFAATSFWRDLVAFSWNLTTVENPAGVADLLDATLEHTDPGGFVTSEARRDRRRHDRVDRVRDGRRSRARPAAAHRRGRPEGLDAAHHALRAQGSRGAAPPAPADGRRPRRHQGAHDLARAAPAGGGEPRIHDPALRAGHRRRPGRHRPRRPAPAARRDRLVIDKHARPGDQWRSRYKSLCLHDPVWYDHLPYLKFPDNWPVFSPKDKIADWLESYTEVMEVPYWSSTTATSAPYSDEETGSGRSRWSATAGRSPSGRSSSVLATGMSGKPNVPELPGRTSSAATSTTPGAPRPGRVRRQEVRGHRQQQLGLRHLRRPVGERRGRHHGPALLDPHRPERHPDGDRARATSTPSGPSTPG